QPDAEGGGRTLTARRPPDFESGASANSATSACDAMVRGADARHLTFAQHCSLRNKKRCATFCGMAVAIATKVDALRIDFGSAARLADMLGVSRAQVTRWLRGSGIDPLNAEKVDLLELVWSNLLRLYEREAASGCVRPASRRGSARSRSRRRWPCTRSTARPPGCAGGRRSSRSG